MGLPRGINFRSSTARCRTGRTGPAVFLLLLFLTSVGRLIAQPDSYSAPEKNWYTIETKHFTVSFHEGEERTARVAAKIGEEIFEPITSLYGHVPDERVNMYFKDISDYSNGAAYFFNNKIEIWASPLDFELRGTHNWLRNVIAHEFTHIIQIQAAMKYGRTIPALAFQWLAYESERRTDVLYGYPNVLVSYPLPGVLVPPWLAEGTAQYMRREFGYETWDSHRDMILRSYVLSDSMLSWADMSAFGKTSLGNESVYNAGFSLARYIARTYGERRLADLTRALRKPFVFSVDGAFEDVLGIGGDSVYADWARALKEDYSRRIAPVIEGKTDEEIIASTGFGNFHPAFSPDGKKIAYVSNKESDYFGQSGVYVYDIETEEETLIVAGARSTVSWSPDGGKLVYSKYNPQSVYGHLYYDLYVYDLREEQETRLTRDRRAYNPSWSPDGEEIAFLFASDGNVNIGTVQSDGTGFRSVTRFTRGEQAYAPKWSPDAKLIVFGYMPQKERQIATVTRSGSILDVLVAENWDNRDPVFSADGTSIYYAADQTGIFNIYRLDLQDKRRERYTNVTGGAFMPSVDAAGSLVFATYRPSGYKIGLMRGSAPLDGATTSYGPASAWSPEHPDLQGEQFDWEQFRNFDDTEIPDPNAKSYRRIFSDMMLFPFLRVDQYNPKNTGIELLKPGLFFFSSDLLDRAELTAGAAINTKFERDLFLSFGYRDHLPILGSIGLYPDVTLEVYNITRKTEAELTFPEYTIPVDVNFNLLEFAATIRHNLIDHRNRMEIGYRHSRYTSGLGSFRLPEIDRLVPASDNLYLIGNDLSFSLRRREILPARDAEINPAGRQVSVRYGYEFNRFNSSGDYEIENGLLVPKYTDYRFHRVEASWNEWIRLPGWRHVASLKLHAGTIIGPAVDDFFNFYAGGIIGMQGYTFYSLGGNSFAYANLAYRFPIVGDMGLKIGHILFDKLYGSIFFDIGDAWTNEKRFFSDLKRDVGFEIRLQAFSFYMYPTSIFFSGAYGLNSFTRPFQGKEITYGNEWRWYFGILFGFDLTDGLRNSMRLRI